MRGALAVVLLLSTGAARADGTWYRVGVTKVDVAAVHHVAGATKPWDTPAAKGEAPKSCCLPGPHGDNALPDVEVTLSMGGRSVGTRLRNDELHPTFRDYGFLERPAGGALTVEVWDRDGDGRELIGRREVTFDGRGVLVPPRGGFGDVEAIELWAEKVSAPEETLALAKPDGELDTHLWIAAHQKLSFAVDGKLCWGKVCGTAGAPGAGDVGQLMVFHGSDDEQKYTAYRPGLELVTESAGPLRLYVKPAPSISNDATGAYRVTVRLRP